MKNLCLLLTLAFSLSLFSCSKDDDSSTPIPTTQTNPADDPAAIQLSSKLISANNWKLTGLSQGVPGQAIYNDIYNNSMPACQRDDVYTFTESGNTLTVAIGLTACTPGEQSKTGTWNLKNSKTLVINAADLTQAGLTGEFTITLLENNKMVLQQTVNGIEYIATYEKFVAPNKTQLLTAKPWVVTALILEQPGTQTIDIYQLLSACSKDDLFIFNTNGNYEINEGPSKCNPSDPQISESGPWSFTNNETKILLDGEEATIMQLTSTRMVLKVNEQSTGGVLTYTFSN